MCSCLILVFNEKLTDKYWLRADYQLSCKCACKASGAKGEERKTIISYF